MLRRLFQRAFASSFFLLFFVALGLPASAQTVAPARVFAAASLTDAMNELSGLYADTGHPRPVINFAAASVLARQIDQGADADLFVSADEAWMDYLAERRLIVASSRGRLLSNLFPVSALETNRLS